ncbi:CLUMA_CG015223, isoform A [Clunio marinus]|uniref:CLUMA_CG015223, isoform A n=1 Tax=Clunio marinus TaxID=568069 RepID=A0A1J1IP33_9DIPT|nr:CLUMA_CG015223, isoform A [Clunio marinus]
MNDHTMHKPLIKIKGRGSTSCLICQKNEQGLEHNRKIVFGTKLLFNTNMFNIMLLSSNVCMNCVGRLHQLFDFNLIKAKIDESKKEFGLTSECDCCEFCDGKNQLLPEKYTSKIWKVIAFTKWSQDYNQDRAVPCCYSCYNFLLLYKEYKEILETQRIEFYNKLYSWTVNLTRLSEEEISKYSREDDIVVEEEEIQSTSQKEHDVENVENIILDKSVDEEASQSLKTITNPTQKKVVRKKPRRGDLTISDFNGNTMNEIDKFSAIKIRRSKTRPSPETEEKSTRKKLNESNSETCDSVPIPEVKNTSSEQVNASDLPQKILKNKTRPSPETREKSTRKKLNESYSETYDSVPIPEVKNTFSEQVTAIDLPQKILKNKSTKKPHSKKLKIDEENEIIPQVNESLENVLNNSEEIMSEIAENESLENVSNYSDEIMPEIEENENKNKEDEPIEKEICNVSNSQEVAINNMHDSTELNVNTDADTNNINIINDLSLYELFNLKKCFVSLERMNAEDCSTEDSQVRKRKQKFVVRLCGNAQKSKIKKLKKGKTKFKTKKKKNLPQSDTIASDEVASEISNKMEGNLKFKVKKSYKKRVAKSENQISKQKAKKEQKQMKKSKINFKNVTNEVVNENEELTKDVIIENSIPDSLINHEEASSQTNTQESPKLNRTRNKQISFKEILKSPFKRSTKLTKKRKYTQKVRFVDNVSEDVALDVLTDEGTSKAEVNVVDLTPEQSIDEENVNLIIPEEFDELDELDLEEFYVDCTDPSRIEVLKPNAEIVTRNEQFNSSSCSSQLTAAVKAVPKLLSEKLIKFDSLCVGPSSLQQIKIPKPSFRSVQKFDILDDEFDLVRKVKRRKTQRKPKTKPKAKSKPTEMIEMEFLSPKFKTKE